MVDRTKIPWDELSQQQKEEFAALCDRFVGIETVDDAEKYYGNKEKLKADARSVTDDG
jgi:hypothetical protein